MTPCTFGLLLRCHDATLAEISGQEGDVGAQRDFNALDYIRELRAAGVKQEQAEVQARYLELVRMDNLSKLVTKDEFKHETALIREELKHETALIREELKHETVLIRKDMKALDVKIETIHNETRKDMKALDVKIETIHRETMSIIKDMKEEIKDTKEEIKDTKTRIDTLSDKFGEQSNKTIYILGTLVVVIATLFALFGKK